MSVPARHGLTLATPQPGLNHVIAYGQSLSTGWEGWPALSLTPRDDSLMLGRSVRGASEDSPGWTPVGDAGLHPLAATVQDHITGEMLGPAQVAALPTGHCALGETVLEAAMRDLRKAMLAGSGDAPTGCRLLASACGVGGRTLEALSPGAHPPLFERLRDCVRAGREAARASGLGYQLLAVLFLQGESNDGTTDGTPDRASYRLLLARLYQEIFAALAQAGAGQLAAPALFTYQTGGAYVADELGVPMAQLDAGLDLPGCFLAAPVYPVTDKGVHLDANGYRWLGAQFGKVMHRVLMLGQDWRPLRPRVAARHRREVLVRFEVPVPPLAWGRPFLGHRPVEVADRGFTLMDAEGVVPLAGVELAGADAVRLLAGREISGSASLRYADKRHDGLGSLHDSDPSLAGDCYEFDTRAGHLPSANILDLLGRPYPLANWCVAFNMPVLPG